MIERANLNSHFRGYRLPARQCAQVVGTIRAASQIALTLTPHCFAVASISLIRAGIVFWAITIAHLRVMDSRLNRLS